MLFSTRSLGIAGGRPMKSYGVSEARKQWSGLLEMAAGGEEIFITRKGKVIAKIVHADDISDEKKEREAIEKRQEEATAHTPGQKTVREMIEEA
ncbi:MAG: hypothetical protein CML30_10395 [Rhizobiales bacterium]|nr:hypothetical protein [Hyphomicrobiales bacterium]